MNDSLLYVHSRLKSSFFFSDRNQKRENEVGFNKKGRVNINFKQGDVKIQMLARNIQDRHMQPFYTTIESGGGSKGYYSHIGEEFGIVLRGKLEINLNGKTYSVGKNESFCFSSHEPYRWAIPGKRKTVFLWG